MNNSVLCVTGFFFGGPGNWIWVTDSVTGGWVKFTGRIHVTSYIKWGASFGIRTCEIDKTTTTTTTKHKRRQTEKEKRVTDEEMEKLKNSVG